jgi:putative ABC transport system permease protein
MGFDDPVGQSVSFDSKEWTVLGVINDFHIFTLQYSTSPVILVFGPERGRYLGVRVETENQLSTAVLGFLQNKWRQYFPESPFEYRFLEDIQSGYYNREKSSSRIFGSFTFLAVLISCLGLFGLMVHSTQQRTREIGIRKVFGAPVKSIISLLIREAVLLVMIANVIACPAAWIFSSSRLQNYANRISINWTVFLFTTLSALGIAVISIGFLTLKAALADPISSLRHE